MLYFREFPKVNYTIEGKSVNVVDITTRVKFLDYIKNTNNNLIINNYSIENEKKPEDISFELYSSYDYTWSILMLNNVYNIFTDWVLPQDAIDKLIIKKYGTIENCQQTIVSWFDEHGYEVDKSSYSRKTYITAYEKIMKENDEKRNIRVFDSSVIAKVQIDLRRNLA